MAKTSDAAVSQVAHQLETLRAFSKYCEASLTGAKAVLRPLQDVAAMRRTLTKVKQLSEGLPLADTALNSLLEGPDACNFLELQEAGQAALQQLEEFRAAVNCLDAVKAVLEDTCAVASAWKEEMGGGGRSQPPQDEPERTLLSLPTSALQNISRRVGNSMRLVCSQLCKAYGSPGTRVVIPNFGDIRHPDAPPEVVHLPPANFDPDDPDDYPDDLDVYDYYDDGDRYEIPAPVPDSCIAAVRAWPSPWEVTKVEVWTSSHAENYPQLLAALAETFPNAMDITTGGPEDLQLLHPGLTRLSVNHNHPDPANLHLSSLTHLTVLQHLEMLQCNLIPHTMGPLQHLTRLTELAVNGYGLDDYPVLSPDMWPALSRLPQLQHLALNVSVAMDAPVPAEAVPMPSLHTASIVTDHQHQSHVAEVFSLFPTGLQSLHLVEVRPPVGEGATNPTTLSQALAGLRCKELLLDLSFKYDVSFVPGAFLVNDLGDRLAGAMPSLERLSLNMTVDTPFNYVAGLSEALRRLLRNPVPLQHLALNFTNADIEPLGLLNSVSRSLPFLTSLELHSEVFWRPQHAVQQTFARSYSSLQRLHLQGFTQIGIFAPHFTRLSALRELHLVLTAKRKLDPQSLSSPYICPCLPVACALLTTLTALESLSVESAWITDAATDTIEAGAAEQSFWLGGVRQLPKLQSLSLLCDARMTSAEVEELLPLPPTLSSIELRSQDAAVLANLQGLLREHVRELRVVQL